MEKQERPSELERHFTVAELTAAGYGSKSLIYKAIEAGELEARRFRSAIRIPASSVAAWAQRAAQR